MATPRATKAALAATVAVTVAALAAFAAARPDERIEARFAGWFLLLFGVLFLVRVAGQVLVRLRRPEWLPPTEEWNLMPYRFLLPVQLAFLGLIAWLVGGFLAGSGPAVEPRDAAGRAVLVLSLVYAGAMAVRYAVRMARTPTARWFGGTIPIVFHWVLAAFLFVLGSYHHSY
jgi:hypothetical protein